MSSENNIDLLFFTCETIIYFHLWKSGQEIRGVSKKNIHMFWANTQLFLKTWVLIPNWFDRVPNSFQIQGWKLKFQGQKGTWFLFYIMISAHNMHLYSSYDKYNHKINTV